MSEVKREEGLTKIDQVGVLQDALQNFTFAQPKTGLEKSSAFQRRSSPVGNSGRLGWQDLFFFDV